MKELQDLTIMGLMRRVKGTDTALSEVSEYLKKEIKSTIRKNLDSKPVDI